MFVASTTTTTPRRATAHMRRSSLRTHYPCFSSYLLVSCIAAITFALALVTLFAHAQLSSSGLDVSSSGIDSSSGLDISSSGLDLSSSEPLPSSSEPLPSSSDLLASSSDLLASSSVVASSSGVAAPLYTVQVVVIAANDSSTQRTWVMRLAARDINNDPTVLPYVALNVTNLPPQNANTTINIRSTTVALLPYLVANAGPYLADVIIPVDSTPSAMATGYLGTTYQVPVITPSSTGPEFADKTSFPYVVRVMPTDDQVIMAVQSLCQTFGWTRIGALVKNNDALIAFADRMYLKLLPFNITVYRYPVPETSSGVRTGVKQTMVDNINILFIHGQGQLLRYFCESANALNLWASGYVGIASPFFSTLSYENSFKLFPAGYNVSNIIGLRAADPSSDWYKNVSASYTKTYGRTLSTADSVFYDVMWTIARVLDRAMQRDGIGRVSGQRFAQLVPGTNFTGITGNFSFSSALDRQVTLSVVQWVYAPLTVNVTGNKTTYTYNSYFVERATWSSQGSIYTPDEDPAAAQFVWGSERSTIAPVDRDPPTGLSYPVDPLTMTSDQAVSTTPVVSGTSPFTFMVVNSNDMPSWLAIDGVTGTLYGSPSDDDIDVELVLELTVMCSNPAGSTTTVMHIRVLQVREYEFAAFLMPIIATLSALTALWILALMGVVFMFRQSVIIKSSSPFFLLWNLVGALWVNFNALLFTTLPTETNHVCELRMWMTPLSILTMLSPLLVKTYRIKRIFIQRQMTVVRLSTRDLVLGVLSTMVLPFVALTAFHAAGKMSVFEQTRASSVGSQYIVAQCTVTDELVYLLLLYVFLLDVWAAHMAWQVRRVPASFNEASHISTVLLFMMLYGALVVPVQYLVANQPFAVNMLRALGLLIGTWVCTIAMYVPKLTVMFQGRQNDKGAYNHSVIEASSDTNNTSGLVTKKLAPPAAKRATGAADSGSGKALSGGPSGMGGGASGALFSSSGGKTTNNNSSSGGNSTPTSGIGLVVGGSICVPGSSMGGEAGGSRGKQTSGGAGGSAPAGSPSSAGGGGGGGAGGAGGITGISPTASPPSSTLVLAKTPSSGMSALKTSSISISQSPSGASSSLSGLNKNGVRPSVSTFNATQRPQQRVSGGNMVGSGQVQAVVATVPASPSTSVKSPTLSALRVSNNFVQVAQYKAVAAAGSDSVSSSPIIGVVNMFDRNAVSRSSISQEAVEAQQTGDSTGTFAPPYAARRQSSSYVSRTPSAAFGAAAGLGGGGASSSSSSALSLATHQGGASSQPMLSTGGYVGGGGAGDVELVARAGGPLSSRGLDANTSHSHQGSTASLYASDALPGSLVMTTDDEADEHSSSCEPGAQGVVTGGGGGERGMDDDSASQSVRPATAGTAGAASTYSTSAMVAAAVAASSDVSDMV